MPLSHSTVDLIEYHVDCSGSSLSDVAVHKYISGCAVWDKWCLRLLVTNFFDGDSQGDPFLTGNK